MVYNFVMLLLVVGAFMVVMLLAPFIVVAQGVLLVLGLLPIGGVRRFVVSVQLALTGSIGDSYVLLESPTRRAAMEQITREGISWLFQRASSVVVVGHSQGAAIAYDVLDQPDVLGQPDVLDQPDAVDESEPSVKTLITIGSGLPKLKLLEEEELDSRLWTLGPVLAVLVVVAVLVPGVFALAGTASATEVVGGLGALALAATVVAGILAANTPHVLLKPAFSPDPIRWVDIYSSADPVPNGPTTTGLVDVPVSHRVRNLASVIGDHSYRARGRGSADREAEGQSSQLGDEA